MKRTACATAIALSAAIAIQTGVGAQAVARDLRIAVDASGAPLAKEAAPPGEKRYHLEEGTTVLHIAFDCIEAGPEVVQVRVTQPPGTILFQEEQSCAEGGTQVVSYDRDDFAFEVNEYAVNMYVTSELYLADSVQFVVGAAVIAESQGDPPAAPSMAPPVQPGVTPAVAQAADPVGQGAGTVGGPSRWMLVVAGIGILGLIAVVGWAGFSAIRS